MDTLSRSAPLLPPRSSASISVKRRDKRGYSGGLLRLLRNWRFGLPRIFRSKIHVPDVEIHQERLLGELVGNSLERNLTP